MAMSRLVGSNQQELNMQRALLNGPTTRVANTTDLSGRVTADEVHLDRFHNPISKVCTFVAATLIPSSLRWMFLLTVLIVPQVLWEADWFATVVEEPITGLI